MIELLLVKVSVDLGCELGDRLRVPDVKEIAHLEVTRQGLHSLLSSLLHDARYLLHLGLREGRLLLVRLRRRRVIVCIVGLGGQGLDLRQQLGDQGLLVLLRDDHFLRVMSLCELGQVNVGYC